MVNYESKKESNAKFEAIAQHNIMAKLKKVPFFIDRILTDLALSINPKFKKDRKTFLLTRDVALMNFLLDCQTSAYKKWSLFRQEISNLLMPTCKGRLEVETRKIRGTGHNEMDKFAGFYDFNKSGMTPFKTLPLHTCKNDAAKIKMITESDATDQVKVDLMLEVVSK